MIELVLRTTESSGLVKEQILARLDGGQALPEADPVLEYSGLCIDSFRHQASYQGQGISLTENYEFHTLRTLPVSQEESLPKSRSTRQSGRKSRWM